MAKRVRLVSTAYGAPWGGIQGTGVTATGIDLRKHPKQYVVAVDPSVIPLGTKLRIKDNPFGDPNIVFTAADTGGAIKGKRLDFYDWRGRKAQMAWGTRPIDAEIVGRGGKPQGAAGGAQGGAGGQGATFIPGKPSSGFDGAGGADLAAVIQAMMSPQRSGGGGGGLASPAFAARAPMPAGYQPIQSGGGPAPKSDIGDVIRQLLPALGGGDIPKANPGTLIPGTGGAAGGGGGPVKGAVGGSPIPGMKPHGATHQTAGLAGYPAYDYMAKAGTRVVAPVGGKIIKVSGHDPANGPTNGPHGPFGLSVYIRGDDGRTYYLTHMGSRDVKVGQRVRRGSPLGTVGNYAKWGGADHVHMGVHG